MTHLRSPWNGAVAVLAAFGLPLCAAPFASAASGNSGVSGVSGVSGSVSPSSAQPGRVVHVTMTGCGSATSASADGGGAFGPVQLRPAGGGAMSASAQVFPTAQRGAEYPVTFSCDGLTAHGTITVAASSPSSSPSPSHSAPPVSSPATPRKGARTGAGGVIGELDATHIGLGAALLVAAVCGGAAVGRGRRSGDRR